MNDNKVAKAAFWYMASSFFLKGIGFFTTPIFARILTTKEYGISENFYAILSILVILGSLCLPTTLISARFDYKDNIICYIKNCLLVSSIITISIIVLSYFLNSFFNNFLFLDFKYFIILFFVILFNPAYEIFILLKQFDYKYKTVSILNILVTLLGIVFSFIFLYIFKDNLFSIILGTQLPLILIGFYIYLRYTFNKESIKTEYIKYAMIICVPYTIHSLAGSLLNSSDKVMITKICGPDSNALYGMAYRVSQLSLLVWIALNTSFVPWLGDKLNLKDYDKIKSFSTKYIIFYFCFTILILLLAPEILLFMGGNKFIEAKYAIPPVIISNLFLFLYSLYVNVEQFVKKTKGMAFATCFSALINVILNIIFIPRIGFIAAAYTTMIGYLIMLFIHHYLVKKIYLNHCYNSKIVFFLAFLGLLLSFIVSFLYTYNSLRYIMIIIYILIVLLLCILKRHKILNFMKSLLRGELYEK